IQTYNLKIAYSSFSSLIMSSQSITNHARNLIKLTKQNGFNLYLVQRSQLHLNGNVLHNNSNNSSSNEKLNEFKDKVRNGPELGDFISGSTAAESENLLKT